MSDWNERPNDGASEDHQDEEKRNEHDGSTPATTPPDAAAFWPSRPRAAEPLPAAPPAQPAETRSAEAPPTAEAPSAAARPAEPAPWGPYSFRPAEALPPRPAPLAPPAGFDLAPPAPAGTPVTPGLTADVQPQGPSTMARVGEELLAWFKTLVSAAVYATLIVTFGFQVARVEGESMAPTLENQDRLIVNKLAYRLADPQVGDIVMLYYPVDPDKSFVKRVIAEPGDRIRSVSGRVSRNDVPLDDDFIPEEFRSHDTWGPQTVPDGYYFVMGDHRSNSSDSRIWSYVPKKYIIGKVQLRWWPIDHARWF